MLKKDWKKNLLRVKQIADQNLGRAEKTEVLSEDLVVLEKRVDLIKQVFQNTTKKLGACIQGQGTDVEKRLRKIPESGLSHSMIESATLLGDNTLMGVMYQLTGDAEGSIAREWLQYEMEVENGVLTPLQGTLETEIPAIAKLRKTLAKITLDMDSARGRYQNAARQTQTSGSMSVNKVDTLKDELEDASTRVEQCRDHLCTEMYSFISKEADYSKLLLELIEEQAKYHRNSLEILERLVPQMKSQMEQCVQMPLFGFGLEDHLRRTNRDIASVIEDCVCTLLEIGMDEEGLFRIAGGASKVKKLKTAFDAGLADMSEYVRDVPCIAGCLKLYLRELPEPLMTYALYNEWMQAAHLPADQRLQALWVVMDKLPRANYNNLRYLIKFLAKLAESQDVNKMSSSNIAIVIGPNLIWPPGESGPSVLTTSTQSAIVESFITHADWFFPGDIDFNPTGSISTPTHVGMATPPILSVHPDVTPVAAPVTPAVAVSPVLHSPVTALCASTLPTATTNSYHTIAAPGADSVSLVGSSPKFNRKLNKKPAPLPPQLPPPPVPPYQGLPADRLPAVTMMTSSPGYEGAVAQVTISSPVLISSSCLADTRPTVPDRPSCHPSSGTPLPQQPNSPRPERPRGPPPERPMGPPPDRPPGVAAGERPDKPDRPHLPPVQRLEAGLERNERKGSGRPARPTPPPPPPPEKRDSYGRDDVDGERPPTPPTRRESQQDAAIVEETHL